MHLLYGCVFKEGIGLQFTTKPNQPSRVSGGLFFNLILENWMKKLVVFTSLAMVACGGGEGKSHLSIRNGEEVSFRNQSPLRTAYP